MCQTMNTQLVLKTADVLRPEAYGLDSDLPHRGTIRAGKDNAVRPTAQHHHVVDVIF